MNKIHIRRDSTMTWVYGIITSLAISYVLISINSIDWESEGNGVIAIILIPLTALIYVSNPRPLITINEYGISYNLKKSTPWRDIRKIKFEKTRFENRLYEEIIVLGVNQETIYRRSLKRTTGNPKQLESKIIHLLSNLKINHVEIVNNVD